MIGMIKSNQITFTYLGEKVDTQGCPIQGSPTMLSLRSEQYQKKNRRNNAILLSIQFKSKQVQNVFILSVF